MIVAYWTRGEEFGRLARLSAESVKRIYPKADFRFIEDDGARPKMVANLDAQIHVLGWAMRGEQILFLDADVLLCKPFPFDLYHDLYVTWRDHVNGDKDAAKMQPYNYGVIACNVRPQVIEAFIWLRARILGMAKKHQDWYGNQLALADLLGQPTQETLETRIRWSLTDPGTLLRAQCLSCDTWNWSPDGESEDISAKGVIHLKGGRKDLMDHYAQRLAA